ncbi:hypothetical protein [Paenibacillus sinopodophylli]|uniref:hypothetical protein n=1 Tax=Paenibacillus sinopodophylli TaxID=1837342 RepID=UPI00110CE918|nr:hypothetical protein [Paenibacillus sinopodophylli]
MNNETVNEKENEQENGKVEMSEEKWAELIKAVRHNGLVALKMHFEEVDVQVLNLEAYGPVFVYHVKDDAADVYSCGFFLRELIARFQSGNDPSVWLASFFVDLMETKGGKPLPQPVTVEDEAKAVIDNILVPQLMNALTEEFAPEPLHASLALNEEHGPVFEAGFPAIKDGNNVCAIPLNVLLTHYQLNRDPGELVIQAMYGIRAQHGLN